MDSGNAEFPLPIQCPNCQHVGSMLLIKSLTVIMVKCASCRHAWATDFDSVPPEIQQKVNEVLQDHRVHGK
jgi:Zn ribbon nucleic-acid-binding protein